MNQMNREYFATQAEKDAKRDEEMKARLAAKFKEMQEFTEKLEEERAAARQREREAMREQKRAYEEEQARIAQRHEEEAAKRLEERRKVGTGNGFSFPLCFPMCTSVIVLRSLNTPR